MYLVPPGYIDLQDAAEEIVRRRYGEPKEITTDPFDTETAERGRRQGYAAHRALRAALTAGRLTAEVDGLKIPGEYWGKSENALTTLRIGVFETNLLDPNFEIHRHHTVSIRRPAFRKWLRQAVRPPRPATPSESSICGQLKAACEANTGARAEAIQQMVKDEIEGEGFAVSREQVRRAWSTLESALKPKRGAPSKQLRR